MKNVEDFLSFVKSQSDFHERQAIRFRDNERRNKLHSGTSEMLNQLYEYLLSTKSVSKKTDTQTNGMSLSWSELEELPQELIEELSITDSDRLDYSIVELIDKCGGVASLDRILVGIYKLTGEILKRVNLNARLYRMGQKEMIFSVPGKKGIYSTSKLKNEETITEMN